MRLTPDGAAVFSPNNSESVMINFILAGGVANLFTLIFGLIAVVAGVLQARRATENRLKVIQALSVSLVASTLCGAAAAFRAVFMAVASQLESGAMDPAQAELLKLVGYSEALTNLILGFALLSITWLLVAVGTRRAG